MGVRTDILRTLSSWAGLVYNERAYAGPIVRTPASLAGFLIENLNWLAAHAAIADFASEIEDVRHSARACIQDRAPRPNDLGTCVHPGCDQSVCPDRSGQKQSAVRRVSCGAGHSWPITEWLLLAQDIRTAKAGSSRVADAASAPNEEVS
jgi:hypothetical protein